VCENFTSKRSSTQRRFGSARAGRKRMCRSSMPLLHLPIPGALRPTGFAEEARKPCSIRPSAASNRRTSRPEQMLVQYHAGDRGACFPSDRSRRRCRQRLPSRPAGSAGVCRARGDTRAPRSERAKPPRRMAILPAASAASARRQRRHRAAPRPRHAPGYEFSICSRQCSRLSAVMSVRVSVMVLQMRMRFESVARETRPF